MAKRKMQKKNKKLVASTPAHYNEDVMRMVKIGVIVIVCFAIIYFATAIYQGEIFNNKKKGNEVTIQQTEILIGETFEKNKDEYYVFYYDFKKDINAGLYDSYVENYNYYHDEAPMYVVNLNKGINSKYLASKEESSNKNVTSLSDLKLKGATLLRIKNKNVVSYVEGKDNITTYIDNINK